MKESRMEWRKISYQSLSPIDTFLYYSPPKTCWLVENQYLQMPRPTNAMILYCNT